MSRRRNRRSVKNQTFHVGRFIKQSVVRYTYPTIATKAIAKIKAVKKKRLEKKISNRLEKNYPNLYSRLPKCKTQTERIRRAFFGFIKSRTPQLSGKGNQTNRHQHDDRFTIKPCRR